ncbi:bacteriophage holin [Legionella cardiaca]|uniref:Bacteriophage holin n=1 Tax=Legionella cardiaca TaxID=1071983 RepID=A0ABY8AQ61_9GAMM|nr:bacteriophage holin [Legionella cardiaca]WED42845.1 bacteriophage holin [Legionella cardiaca]
MNKCKLCPVSLGLSLGILWGVFVLIIGLIATYNAYGKPFVAAMGGLYIGYQPTILGSLIGGLIAFIDFFIFGFLIAWLYNLFACCCHKKESIDKEPLA